MKKPVKATIAGTGTKPADTAPREPMTAPVAPASEPQAAPPAAPEPVATADETAGPRAADVAASRVPFGAMNQRLAAPQRDGYVRRWFNDRPGRIDRAKRASWAHVQDETTGHPMMIIGGVAPEGGGLKQYLMEIPQELYEQDQQAKQAAIDETEAAMKRGEVDGKAPGQDGRFQPMNADGTPRTQFKVSAGRTG